MTHSERHTTAALTTLILLQIIMLSALYAGIKPHPPVATPLFGIAPFIGAAVSVALSAIIVGPLGSRVGQGLSVLAGAMALMSFGPQKYLDPQLGLIWPAVVLGQLAVVVIVASVIGALRMAERDTLISGARVGRV